MLLQSSTLGELCAGVGTMSVAAAILRDNVFFELGARVKLEPVFAVVGLLTLLLGVT